MGLVDSVAADNVDESYQIYAVYRIDQISRFCKRTIDT